MKKERPPALTLMCVFFGFLLLRMGYDLFGELTTHATNAVQNAKEADYVTHMNIPLHVGFMVALGMGLHGIWSMMRWGVYTTSTYFVAKMIFEFNQYQVNMATVGICLVGLALPWIYVTQMDAMEPLEPLEDDDDE